MNSPTYQKIIQAIIVIGVLVLPALLHAQNELIANPDGAVPLRRVWTMQGDGVKGGQQIGRRVARLFDVDGDGDEEFGVYRGDSNRWMFFNGGDPPEVSAFASLDSIMSRAPVVGDFQGDGQRELIFMKARVEGLDSVPRFFYRPMLHRISPTRIEEVTFSSAEHRCFIDLQGEELNGKAGKEVVMLRGCTSRDILIYEGGPGFQLDSPQVVISDELNVTAWTVKFGDYDGDSRVDMVTGGEYPGSGWQLKFWWGDESSPGSWAERGPDRVIDLTDEIGLSHIQHMHDLDGDGAVDLSGIVFEGNRAGIYLYLTGSGQSARDRSFDLDNADQYYATTEYSRIGQVGYLNDGSNRYEMFGLVSRDAQTLLFLSGGPEGPDSTYEAIYRPGSDGLGGGIAVSGLNQPLGDVTGNGYCDYISAQPNYGIARSGLAFILAGGPYIPIDDTTVSVSEYPVAGERGGLYLWPNPVVEELHIAWKGNLKSLPSRFVVYDMEGREIIAGDVDPYGGMALWRCGSIPSGAYVITAFDSTGQILSTARIIKE